MKKILVCISFFFSLSSFAQNGFGLNGGIHIPHFLNATEGLHPRLHTDTKLFYSIGVFGRFAITPRYNQKLMLQYYSVTTEAIYGAGDSMGYGTDTGTHTYKFGGISYLHEFAVFPKFRLFPTVGLSVNNLVNTHHYGTHYNGTTAPYTPTLHTYPYDNIIKDKGFCEFSFILGLAQYIRLTNHFDLCIEAYYKNALNTIWIDSNKSFGLRMKDFQFNLGLVYKTKNNKAKKEEQQKPID